MSRAPRDELDRYFTPPEFAEAAVAMLDDYCGLEGKQCLEPHVGAGAFAEALLRRDIESLQTIDIDPDCPWMREPQEFLAPRFCLTHTTADFLKWAAIPEGNERCNPFDIICGNPPFNAAEQHLRAAHSLLSPRGVMAFILPLHFLGSVGRRDFYRELMPTEIHTIRPRIPFAQEMREMGLFVWDKQAMGLGRRSFQTTWIDWTPTKKPRKPRKSGEIGTDTNGREEHEEANQEDGDEEAGRDESDLEAGSSNDREPRLERGRLVKAIQTSPKGEIISGHQRARALGLIEAQGSAATEGGRGEGPAVPEGTALCPDDS
jgi:predicted RNA methylase